MSSACLTLWPQPTIYSKPRAIPNLMFVCTTARITVRTRALNAISSPCRAQIVPKLRSEVTYWRELVPLVAALRNPHLRERHWVKVCRVLDRWPRTSVASGQGTHHAKHCTVVRCGRTGVSSPSHTLLLPCTPLPRLHAAVVRQMLATRVWHPSTLPHACRLTRWWAPSSTATRASRCRSCWT